MTKKEKANKPFNWQRPTATIYETPDGKILQHNVLSGQAYVEHYAAIMATYFASTLFNGAHVPSVHYVLPATGACAALFASSNVPSMDSIDVAILGYIDKFPSCTGPGD